jgi:hypothetical protein
MQRQAGFRKRGIRPFAVPQTGNSCRVPVILMIERVNTVIERVITVTVRVISMIVRVNPVTVLINKMTVKINTVAVRVDTMSVRVKTVPGLISRTTARGNPAALMAKTAGLQAVPAAKITGSATEITLTAPLFPLPKTGLVRIFKHPPFRKCLSVKRLLNTINKNLT